MTVWIAPWRLSSKGAKGVANELGIKRIKPVSSRYRYRSGDKIVNWGRGEVPFPVTLNQPEAVHNAVNKRRAFRLFNDRGVATVDSTTDRNVAEEWLQAGFFVYARETITGHGGRGIRVLSGHSGIRSLREIVHCELYTKGFPTNREFRVHVVGDQAISVLEKKQRNGTNPDPFIRSHGDWVFCRNNLASYPEAVKEQAVAAVKALGLDFGGVDIALDCEDNVCVFEVNSAPGLEGTSTVLFANALKDLLEERN